MELNSPERCREMHKISSFLEAIYKFKGQPVPAGIAGVMEQGPDRCFGANLESYTKQLVDWLTSNWLSDYELNKLMYDSRSRLSRDFANWWEDYCVMLPDQSHDTTATKQY